MRPLVAYAALSLITSAAIAGPFDRTDTVTVSTSDELRRVAAAAIPGVTILLKPGEYGGGITLDGLRGAEGKPIVIAGADPDHPPRIVGGSGVHLVNPAYLELRDVVIERSGGNGLNIDDGGSMKHSAGSITVRRVVVRDLTSKGNLDGIKLSGLRSFTIDTCTIERWGSGGSGIDMVGCAEGKIIGCTLRCDPAAPPSSGIQAKGGTRDVVIERCRFEHAGDRSVNLGGSTGMAYFRPQPPPGYEAKNLTVRFCTFIGSQAPISFVGCDGALVERNTFYRPRKWVMRILQETTAEGFVPCRNGRFERNVIVFRSDEVRTFANVGPNTKPDTFTFAGNWWYCVDRPASSRPQLPTVERDGVYGRDPQLVDPERGDVSIRVGSPAMDVGAGESPK